MLRKGLEAEGLTGLGNFVEGTGVERVQRIIERKQGYRDIDIFLPRCTFISRGEVGENSIMSVTF